jgi:hypothetical protein
MIDSAPAVPGIKHVLLVCEIIATQIGKPFYRPLNASKVFNHLWAKFEHCGATIKPD